MYQQLMQQDVQQAMLTSAGLIPDEDNYEKEEPQAAAEWIPRLKFGKNQRHVYLSDLAFEATEVNVREYFEYNAGEIAQLHMPTHKVTSKTSFNTIYEKIETRRMHKGTAVIKFYTQKALRKALRKHKSLLKGRPLNVFPRKPKKGSNKRRKAAAAAAASSTPVQRAVPAPPPPTKSMDVRSLFDARNPYLAEFTGEKRMRMTMTPDGPQMTEIDEDEDGPRKPSIERWKKRKKLQNFQRNKRSRRRSRSSSQDKDEVEEETGNIESLDTTETTSTTDTPADNATSSAASNEKTASGGGNTTVPYARRRKKRKTQDKPRFFT